jgi:hypothetical protein
LGLELKIETVSASGLTLTRNVSSRERAMGLDWDGPPKVEIGEITPITFWARIAPVTVKITGSKSTRPRARGRLMDLRATFRFACSCLNFERTPTSARMVLPSLIIPYLLVAYF